MAVKSCHDSGKTAIAARVVIWFLMAHQPAIVLTTAPTWRQVEELLWREIHKAHEEAQGGALPGGIGGVLLNTKLEWSKDTYAIGISTNDPIKFQGFHAPNILLVADEAPGVSEDVFTAADTSLTSENARELLIGNPVEVSGRFYDAFHGKRDLYQTITISAFDTPNFTAFGITLDDIRRGTWQKKITGPLPRPYLVTPGWVFEKWEEWGEDSPLWQVRVLGDFPAVAADQLIPLSWIEQAITREIIEPESAPNILGCDVARFGEDETIICVRQGSVVKSVVPFWHQDLMVTTGRVIEVLRAHDGKAANVEVDGMGAGVVDRLYELRLPVRAVRCGESAHQRKKYANRRSELWWGLRERFRLGNIRIPRDDILISQLVAVKYTVTSSGQIQVESKEDMKKRGLKSPDRADAVMLAFAGEELKPFPVVPVVRKGYRRMGE